MNLLFADTETTGTEAEDRLCQLCYNYRGMEFNALFKPPLPIKCGAMAVHHITNEMVETKPPFIDSFEFIALQTILQNAVFVAHNATFDVKMLEKEGLKVPRIIDTLKISRHLDEEGMMESHKLQYLRYYYGLKIEAVAHDAMGDVHVLMKVFEVLRNLLIMEEGLDIEQALVRMVEISSKPTLMRRFRFGKHKGKLVAEVAQIDRGYLSWWRKEKLQSAEDETDWLYTLDTYLK